MRSAASHSPSDRPRTAFPPLPTPCVRVLYSTMMIRWWTVVCWLVVSHLISRVCTCMAAMRRTSLPAVWRATCGVVASLMWGEQWPELSGEVWDRKLWAVAEDKRRPVRSQRKYAANFVLGPLPCIFTGLASVSVAHSGKSVNCSPIVMPVTSGRSRYASPTSIQHVLPEKKYCHNF